MGHQPANGDITLAGLGELRPILRDRRVEVEASLLGQPMGAERDQAFGRRGDVDQCVTVPLALAIERVPATPEVDDRLAVEIDGDCRADFVTLAEVALECLADSVELWVVPAVDWSGHGLPPGLGSPLCLRHLPPQGDP